MMLIEQIFADLLINICDISYSQVRECHLCSIRKFVIHPLLLGFHFHENDNLQESRGKHQDFFSIFNHFKKLIK